MPRSASPDRLRAENLSAEELRRLLVEKRRADRQARLERFRKTGRVVSLSTEIESGMLGSLRSRESEAELLAPAALPARRSAGRRLVDGLLLLIEVGAVLGLVFILLSGMDLLQELNREVLAAIEQPTMTPTPLVSAVVLPSGHTPPNAPGGARPNDAEIPEHLRPLVQSLANIPIPTPGPEHAIQIKIPAIGIDAPIVQGDGWEQLKKGVGQHIGTANPGQKGNVVLSAHNDVFGEIFRQLDRLAPGDQVILFTNQRAYTYVITASQVVEPTRVEVMSATRDATLTLISCYPYMVNDQRIVVTARLQSGS
jgi:sortase A